MPEMLWFFIIILGWKGFVLMANRILGMLLVSLCYTFTTVVLSTSVDLMVTKK